ncbi:MAG TPA: 16S rRNA (guanine(966)-N(2))-methyltransferase RsmD [Candidatus Eisenbacteria bacterium]
MTLRADFVRVIAGQFGGRRLAAPRGHRTRPSSDRVREALFMALEPLTGMRVVDLYAGSGALGIEALSRGAIHADFVEVDRAARAALERNLDSLGLVALATVWSLKLPRGLERLAAELEAADLILADPPYGGEVARGLLGMLGRGDWLRDGARVVVEHHAKDDLPESVGRLACTRRRRYGQTVVSTYQARAGRDPGATEESRP